MFARSQQLSAPLVLPMLASTLSVGILASIFLLPPPRATLSLPQLLLQGALDLTLAACIHLVTVTAIWRLIHEYIEPPCGTLALHIWAAVLWLPLIITLSAERSLWISCIIPWACANAITFLNLWSTLPAEDAPGTPLVRILFLPPPSTALWRTLLPWCITIVMMQTGAAVLVSGHPWSASALFSAGIILFLVRHPFLRHLPRRRQGFSRASILQTAAVFFLITTALTPYLQKAYGLSALSSFLATRPSSPVVRRVAPASEYSGIILTVPAQPHTHIEPHPSSTRPSVSATPAKPIVIHFDGTYWYFKDPDTRPRSDAPVQQGDPIKADVRSTDYRDLKMEAHQRLPDAISGDCCHAMRIDLLNGDYRPGVIRIELLLSDTSSKTGSPLTLGSVSIPSSQLRHISINRPPVPESLRFQMPASAHGRHFDEITVVIKPSSDRARAGSKIAIRSFVLIP